MIIFHLIHEKKKKTSINNSTYSACYFKWSEEGFSVFRCRGSSLWLSSSSRWRQVEQLDEEQRGKLRFMGASCQSEEAWSTVAAVTSRRCRGTSGREKTWFIWAHFIKTLLSLSLGLLSDTDWTPDYLLKLSKCGDLCENANVRVRSCGCFSDLTFLTDDRCKTGKEKKQRKTKKNM